MAVPSAVTLDQIVTEALKRAGRTTPSSDVISSAKTHQFREVKSDMEQVFGVTLPDVYGEAWSNTGVGRSTNNYPVHFTKIDAIKLYEVGTTSDGYVGTIQSMSGNNPTVSSSLDVDEADIQGKWFVIQSGTGVNQAAQINTWNNTTKEIGIYGNWPTTPVATSGYAIALTEHYIEEVDFTYDFMRSNPTTTRGLPTQWSSRWAAEAPVPDEDTNLLSVRWNRIPDKAYPILWSGQYQLDYLDESGTLLTELLRKYRSVWIQGIAAYSMQLYDEDRFFQTYQIYRNMLDALSSQHTQIYLMGYNDL